MNHEKTKNAKKVLKKVTYIGVWVNLGLGVFKLIVGSLVHSVALIADGLHSLSDLASDLAVIIGLFLGGRKPDQKHPYGHGRAETFSAFFIALGLIVVGGSMIYYAGMQIAKGRTSNPHMVVIVAASVSVLAKEIIFHVTKKVAIANSSSMLYANAWHHRTDALSSLAVIIGVIAGFLGFDFGDQFAAVAVGVMIIIVGASIINGCFKEVSEESVDSKTVEKISQIINSNKDVMQWHDLKTRTLGREIFMELHILVDPELNITQAHEIAEQVEEKLHAEMIRPINITIHIEPNIERLQK